MTSLNSSISNGKLRPKVKSGRRVGLDDLADEIAGRSGFDRGDARDFAYKFAQSMVDHLKYGDSVQLGELGSFGVSCSKDRELRVSYRASKAIKNQLATDTSMNSVQAFGARSSTRRTPAWTMRASPNCG